MFEFDPLSRPVAIAEMLLLLSVTAFVGWLLARLMLSGRVKTLQNEVANKEAELENCRRSKFSRPAPNPANAVRATPVPVDMPPSIPDVAPVVPAMAAPVSEMPVEVIPTPVLSAEPVTSKAPVSAPTGNSEEAVLSRIAARANEINFDRIGRATAAEADDLKEIMGVGPFLERKLHSLGIYTFRQVSNFTKEDTKLINEIIEFFPGRIERDDWVGQSKAFHDRKYGGKAEA